MTAELKPPDTGAAPTVPPPPPTPSWSLTKVFVVGGLLVAAGLWLVLALLPGILSRPSPATEQPTGSGAVEARRIQASLFYVSDDGGELVPVTRDVPFGATPVEQARRIVEAQVGAPADGRVSAIPTGTTVRGVFLGSRGDAYVDLSSEMMSAHRGGALDEALAVFAIVNAITSNLPDVTAVQILVDGKEVDSIAGHIDLRQPIRRAADWVRKGQ